MLCIFLWIAGLIIRKEASVTSRYVFFTVLFQILAYTRRIFKKGGNLMLDLFFLMP